MERKALMEAVAARSLALRMELATVCTRAGLSQTIAQRWNRGEGTPRLPTIAKLERALDEIEAERVAA